jgi:hypothetical protein
MAMRKLLALMAAGIAIYIFSSGMYAVVNDHVMYNRFTGQMWEYKCTKYVEDGGTYNGGATLTCRTFSWVER